MKCEICHKAAAETAFCPEDGDNDAELYVCAECAAAERQRRDGNRAHDDGDENASPVLSIEGEIGPEGLMAPMRILSSVSDLVHGLAKDLGKRLGRKRKHPGLSPVPLTGLDRRVVLGDRLHLEGLFMIGEIDAVRRGVHALSMDLPGVDVNGVTNAGHVYSLMCGQDCEAAKRVLKALVREEHNARIRLMDELPQVFGDSVCRSLALLGRCRLLSDGELFDLLSPLRLAAHANLIEGISAAAIERLALDCKLDGEEDKLEPAERDEICSVRANEMNACFKSVGLTALGRDRFFP